MKDLNMFHAKFPVAEIKKSKANDKIYEGFSKTNFDDRNLLESIREKGILEPLVISIDNFLLSGHRRYSAARHLKLQYVPVRVLQIKFRILDEGEKLKLLSEFNQQRDKSTEEKINETFARTDPLMADFEIRCRKYEKKLKAESESNLILGNKKKRYNITTQRFLLAVIDVVNKQQKYWPMTDRRVHYLLLNDPPLKHDKKPGSTYQNDKTSYKALTNLLTRARLMGFIPMHAIEDSTRPVQLGGGFSSVEEYCQDSIKDLMLGYQRDLQNGQANHIEIILEKNALRPIVAEVAAEYCTPLTVARGYLSLPPKAQIAQRFNDSKKETLVLLFLTDFDPDGEEIAKSTARSLRDDFGIPGNNIKAVKVALTKADIIENDLPSDMEAKRTSPNYNKFFKEHKTDRVVELDAAPVELLQTKLRENIESFMDIDEYNNQIKIQENDNVIIYAHRKVILELFKNSKNRTSPNFHK